MIQFLLNARTCPTRGVLRTWTRGLVTVASVGFMFSGLVGMPGLARFLDPAGGAWTTGLALSAMGACTLAASGVVLRTAVQLRLEEGLCPACGYDLSGSADICSECGESSAERDSDAASQRVRRFRRVLLSISVACFAVLAVLSLPWIVTAAEPLMRGLLAIPIFAGLLGATLFAVAVTARADRG